MLCLHLLLGECQVLFQRRQVGHVICLRFLQGCHAILVCVLCSLLISMCCGGFLLRLCEDVLQHLDNCCALGPLAWSAIPSFGRGWIFLKKSVITSSLILLIEVGEYADCLLEQSFRISDVVGVLLVGRILSLAHARLSCLALFICHQGFLQTLDLHQHAVFWVVDGQVDGLNRTVELGLCRTLRSQGSLRRITFLVAPLQLFLIRLAFLDQ
mmetsp:Transcript_90/g.248  ORF Transcript_90/g.248 Transcript_90/m.248 type:complete len:212 (+) Transcript_90:378-1013(+)